MDSPESGYWLRLMWTQGMTFAFAKDLLKTFGLPQKIFGQTASALAEIVPHPIAKQLARRTDPLIEARVEDVRNWLASTPGASLVTVADADYPVALLSVPEPPLVFFAQGRRELMTRRSVSFVGASSPTSEALETLEAWIREIRNEPVLVVEETLPGIPLAALKACHASGCPACVIPTKALAARPVLSPINLYLTTDPAGNDPEGNRRLYASLTENFVMLEDTQYSPNLKLMREALDLNKNVMAVPGSIHSPLSRAPHKLIREGALLIESAAELLRSMSQD